MERTTSWHAEVERSFSVHFVSLTFSTMFFLYVIIYIEIITYSQNIILHDLQLNRGLQALRNNGDTDM